MGGVKRGSNKDGREKEQGRKLAGIVVSNYLPGLYLQERQQHPSSNSFWSI